MFKRSAKNVVNTGDSAARGEDKSSPVRGKAKRDLYLVPEQELPESSGDLADTVETEKEVLHEHSLKKGMEPMPGMSEQKGPKLRGERTGSETPAKLDRGEAAPNQVESATPIKGKSIEGGGATSGTTAGFGGAGLGKPTDASIGSMTGYGTGPGPASGISNRGSPGSIEVHGPGQSGQQIKREKKNKT